MADSVLTSGFSFISKHIWMKICIVLAILGICSKSTKFSAGVHGMWVHISGRQIVALGMLNSRIITGWGRWRPGQRWRWLWGRLSASVRWRYTCSFASPVCLRILGSAILARKASGRVVLTKDSWVSFYCSLHLFMPRELNTPLFLFSDLGVRFLDQVLRFPYRGPPKPCFGHSGHLQCQMHVGLFQLYLTPLACHSCRHVEYLQEISCCF